MPKGWVLYAAHAAPDRLVVFVHGFRGGAVRTWREFDSSGTRDPWWEASDLLFIGYDSVHENITGVATRLRHELPGLYPSVRDNHLNDLLATLRDGSPGYQELVLVGHSLGGLIVRRALADAALEWLERRSADAGAAMPGLLHAQVRLFSPASAGFRSAGALGILQASPGWLGLQMLLRRSSAFVDLQPTSPVLRATQRRTEQLVADEPDAMRALCPAILWSNPDNVVNTERYDSDPVDDVVDGRSHSTVCKPHDGYGTPRTFVRSGRSR